LDSKFPVKLRGNFLLYFTILIILAEEYKS
jgi:hypothetical protein